MKKLLMSFVLFMMFSDVFADPISSAAIVARLIKQYEQLKEQYNRLGDQLNEAKKLTLDNEGDYHLGEIGESDRDFNNRSWSPNTWNDALKDLSGGNEGRYQELLSEYKKNHPTLSQTEYSKGASAARTRLYSQTIGTNKISSIESIHTFNSINEHLKSIHALTKRIDSAPNSKAATDLNSRLVAEVAYISAQELKMQSIMNKQLSQQSANQMDASSRASRFNQLPKK